LINPGGSKKKREGKCFGSVVEKKEKRGKKGLVRPIPVGGEKKDPPKVVQGRKKVRERQAVPKELKEREREKWGGKKVPDIREKKKGFFRGTGMLKGTKVAREGGEKRGGEEFPKRREQKKSLECA